MELNNAFTSLPWSNGPLILSIMISPFSGSLRHFVISGIASLLSISIASSVVFVRAADALLITEVMSNNQTTLLDDFGEYPDWIEIHNAGSESLDTAGYFLTDDAADLRKWRFPSRKLAPGGFLLVFASGADRLEPDRPLHTNFRLSSSGEYLALVKPDGATIAQEFAPAIPAQAIDVSYGLAFEELKGGVVVPTTAPSRILIPSKEIGLNWTGAGFDDSQWVATSMPVRYNRNRPGTVFDSIAGNDIEALIFGENASALIRIPFSMPNVSGLTDFQFLISYDDGFVAYLNGKEIARDRAPEVLEWNSEASVPRIRELDPVNGRIDLTARLGLLIPGENVLAIHALNRNAFDLDFFMGPELIARDARVIPGTARFFSRPSPGFGNFGGSPGRAADVSFSRTTTTFAEPFSVTLESVGQIPGTKIRYTTDRTAPTEESPLYIGSIEITATTQLRARAFAPGFLPGPLRTETYLQVDSTASNFTSDLPILVIHTLGGGSIVEGTERPSVITVHEPVRGRSSILNPPQLTTRAGFRTRGSSTAGQVKANYAVEFWDENDQARDLEFLGMPAESDWVFHAPFNFDPALFRNPLAFEMSNQLGRYAPRYRFVEVFVNSRTSGSTLAFSHYVGVYNILEKIKLGKDRVDIDALRPGDIEEPEVTGGYILKVDRVDPGDTGFSSGGRTVAYVEPKEDEIQSLERDPQEKYIGSYMAAFWTALRGAAFTDPIRGYSPFIDLGSWIDQHIVDTVTFNVDALRLSSYFHKPRGGPLVYGPVWDYDRSLGSTDGRDVNPSVWGGGFFTELWWDRMFRDPNFWQAWIDRWQSTRAAQLSDRNINAMIDLFALQVKESAERDFTRWRQAKRGRSQEGEILHLKNWLWERTTFMDTNLLSRPQWTRAGGYFVEGVDLGMIGPEGSTIYYTLDGSDPRLPGGIVSPTAISYNGPIKLRTDTVVRARAHDLTFAPRRAGGGPPIVSPWSGIVAAEFASNPLARFGEIAVMEIHYNPAEPTAGELARDPQLKNDDFEFIELQNISGKRVSLFGARFEDGIQFSFDSNLARSIDSDGRILLVRNRSAFEMRYGNPTGIVAQYSGTLGNNGERLRLRAADGTEIFDFSFRDVWFPATDGSGFSLVLADKRATPKAYGDRSSWRPSAARNGSPDGADPVPSEVPEVVVNEVNLFGDAGDGVELRNLSASIANIGGWYLTDDRNTPRKFRIPSGVSIPAHGFVVFDEDDFNSSNGPGLKFSFSRFGDNVFLFEGDANGNIGRYAHGFSFGPSDKNVSFGRYISSAGDEHFVAQSAVTLSQQNSGPQIGPIVINEVMYHPPDILLNGQYWDFPEDEFVELRNITDQPVDLSDPENPGKVWTLRGGIRFDFPPKVAIPARGYAVVVPFDPATDGLRLADFRSKFSVAPNVLVLGPFTGKLSNGSDTLRLHKPGVADEQTEPRILVDELSYSDQLPWPGAADGLGHSLQRSVGDQYGNDPGNWISADATVGAPNRVAAPPVITTQPLDVSVVAGGDAQFGVIATGSGSLRYQWRFRGGDRADSASAVLTLRNAQVSDAGDYSVVVFNPDGSALSRTAALKVTESLSITQNPIGVNVLPGANVKLSVTVKAPGRLDYQWRFNESDIAGANGSALALTNAQLEESGDYSVSVSDGLRTVVSAPARVNVMVVPVISEHPHSSIALVGDTVVLSVSAIGTPPLSYRWRAGSVTVQEGPNPVLRLENVQTSAANSYTVLISNVATGTRGILGLPAVLIVLDDLDGDGMADDWERQHGLAINALSDALLDLDADGYSNIQEYFADTDPMDPLSLLKFDSVLIEGGSAVLEFVARTNRLYAVQYLNSLSDSSWRNLTNISVSFENQVQRVIDTNLDRESRFYRLLIPSK